jgi:hypothetical protein
MESVELVMTGSAHIWAKALSGTGEMLPAPPVHAHLPVVKLCSYAATGCNALHACERRAPATSGR